MRNRLAILAMIMAAMASIAAAQVAAPYELRSSHEQLLQIQNLPALKQLAETIKADKFPYPFALSDSFERPGKDAGPAGAAIRMKQFEGRTVLAISGNYMAAYGAPERDRQGRARQTFRDVFLPIFTAVEKTLPAASGWDSVLVEVSYHVRKKVLGVRNENLETIAILLPVEGLHRLLTAKSVDTQQDVLLNGVQYLNAEPFLLWLRDDSLTKDDEQRLLAESFDRQEIKTEHVAPPRRNSSGNLVAAALLPARTWNPKSAPLLSAEDLNHEYAATLEELTRSLRAEGRLLEYAPPEFIDFHGAAYLQITSTMQFDVAAASRYKLAALALDQDIVHRIRPLLATLPAGKPGFAGVAFSMNLKRSGETDATCAAEFFLALNDLRAFSQFDMTSQELVNKGIVLLDGERSEVDLIAAER